MENYLINYSDYKDIWEAVSYFSCEIFLLIGVLVNFVLFFLKKKFDTKRLSNFITACLFGFNAFVLSVVCIKNIFVFGGFTATFWNDYLEADSHNFVLKISINLFMLFFIIITHKFTRKCRFKVPIINSILALLAMTGCLIVQSESFILTYILIEALCLFVYKYGSNMRIRKYSVFSDDFLLISISSTLIFVIFYTMTFAIDKLSQLSIIKVCMAIAILMKLGIFPIHNYTVNKKYKTNIPYSILLFCYMPWVGVLALNKMAKTITPSDEIFQASLSIFIVICMISFSFYASKQKNLVKFLANISYFLTSFCVLDIVFFQTNNTSVILSSLLAFSIISIYSLLGIAKLNLNLEKINILSLKGLFLNNRFFAILLSLLLLMISGVIPNGIMRYNIDILKNIYTYDKIGVFTVGFALIGFILIIFNTFRIIQSLYTFDKSQIVDKFKIGTTPDYVIPILVLIIIFIKTL